MTKVSKATFCSICGESALRLQNEEANLFLYNCNFLRRSRQRKGYSFTRFLGVRSSIIDKSFNYVKIVWPINIFLRFLKKLL